MSKAVLKQNKKLKIALVILSVALLLAVGGIFGIYAAMQQTVQTSFSVAYSIGDNVAVAVGANSQPYDGNSTWFTANQGIKQANNLYALGAGHKDDQNIKLTGGNITFPAGDGYLKFYFENLSDEKSIKVTVTNTIVPLNMYTQYIGATVPSTEGMDFETSPTDNTTFTVAPGKIYLFAIVLFPLDQNRKATFETTETTGISFLVQQA